MLLEPVDLNDYLVLFLDALLKLFEIVYLLINYVRLFSLMIGSDHFKTSFNRRLLINIYIMICKYKFIKSKKYVFNINKIENKNSLIISWVYWCLMNFINDNLWINIQTQYFSLKISFIFLFTYKQQLKI